MTDLEHELRELIVNSLQLEDVGADDIDVAAPLFGEGLGLDSIDALELTMAIQKQFGVKIDTASEQTREIFGSVRALATYIDQHRSG